VHPRRENDRFPNSYILRVRRKISHDQHVNIVTRQRLTQDRFAYLILILEAAPFLNIFNEVCVSIRIAVGKINRIVFMLKFNLERQCIVEWTITSVLLLE